MARVRAGFTIPPPVALGGGGIGRRRRGPSGWSRRPRVPAVAVIGMAMLAAGLLGLHGITGGASATGAVPTTTPPGTVSQWIAAADVVLTANGTSATALNDADVWIIIRNESGGNPNSINRTDSNAAQGNPSAGLMQTTGTTFRAHAVPGHGDIWNPVDNIVAGVRYAIGRYGSLDNVPGVLSVHRGGGYLPY